MTRFKNHTPLLSLLRSCRIKIFNPFSWIEFFTPGCLTIFGGAFVTVLTF